MDISQRIKSVRTDNGLTQEELAEKLDVTRQSISNWENGRSYPDIVSVVKLSEVFSVSLDELIKGDEKMLAYLDQNTNIVKRKNRIIKLIEIITFILIWIACAAAYFIKGHLISVEAQITIMQAILPITYLLFAVIAGIDNQWKKYKIAVPFVFGIFNYLIFIVARCIFDGSELNVFDLVFVSSGFLMFSTGFAVSLIGIVFGGIFNKNKAKN